jgi:hypothetical protein
VESSCELGNEPLGSIKCWELPSGCTTCGLSSGAELHRVRLSDTLSLDIGAHPKIRYVAYSDTSPSFMSIALSEAWYIAFVEVAQDMPVSRCNELDGPWELSTEMIPGR